MEFINVITMTSGIIDAGGIKTFIFPNTDIEKQKATVKQAEDNFKEKILKIRGNESEMDEYLDNGYYDNGKQEVHIIWSN